MVIENSQYTFDSNINQFKSLEIKLEHKQISESECEKKEPINSNGFSTLDKLSNNRNKTDYQLKNDECPVHFYSLFRYSNCCDKVLIFIAALFAISAGACLPLLMLIFGILGGKFVDNHDLFYNMTILRNASNSQTLQTFRHEISNLCAYSAILGVLMFCFSYIYVSLFSISALNQAFRIRTRFARSVFRQELEWFDTCEIGDFANQITSNLSKIQEGIGEKLGLFVSYISIFVISTSIAFYYGWELTLVCLSITPFLTVAVLIFSKILAKVASKEFQAYEVAGSVAEEVFSSIRTVTSFGGEKKEIERYNQSLKPGLKKGITRSLLSSTIEALIWLSIFSGYILAFWYGVKLIAAGKNEEIPRYDAKTVLIVFLNIIVGTGYVVAIVPLLEQFTIACGAAGKIFSIIERKSLIDSCSDVGKIPQSIHGIIELKDVHFNYPSRPDVPILKGVTLKVNCGETVAFVGPSGCGKSTIIQLIQRFYDPGHGAVEIDGNNTKDLNVGWLRDQISLVGQEPVLFSTTIGENIAYGAKHATQEEIEKVAKLANVHNFVFALPLKYDTFVGEGGTQLSGGQKQRIAIARALLKNPKILLLDEATSALDTESEAIVQAALIRASQGRTTIIVAHRLSTIQNADKIVTLFDGIVQEVGTHDELIKNKRIYYNLVMTQFKEIDNSEDSDEDLNDSLYSFNRHNSIVSYMSDNSVACRNGTVSFHYNGSVTSMEFAKKEDILEPSLVRLLKMCKPEWPYLAVGSIAAILNGLVLPALGVWSGETVRVFGERKEDLLQDDIVYATFLLGVAIYAAITSFFRSFMFSVAGEKFTGRLRKMLFTTMITQDISWFDKPENSVGSLCSRLISDASSLHGVTGSQLSITLKTLSTLTAAIVIALYYNYKIGLAVFSFVPLLLLGAFLEKKLFLGNILNEKLDIENAAKVAIEGIENIKTVASLHLEEPLYVQFKTCLQKFHKKSINKCHIRGITYGYAQSNSYFAYAAGLYYGTILILAGELTYPNLFKIIKVIVLGAFSMGQTVAFTPDYQKAKQAAARILNLLDLKSKINVFTPDGCILENIKGYIGFQNVCFSYPSRPKVKVLRHLNLEINPGQTVALVGASGCGKSTCVQLIDRFYDAPKGNVIIDEVCVKNMNISNLRSHIGLVSQEPVLFSYSIAENIAYGDNSRNVNMDEIISAAKEANIHNFITTLPQGYDTLVGFKGAQLSGGQKQRVAIARALVRNPKILLLDEATSALDVESEQVVQEALDKASNGRTCLVIAHRLTTIQNADIIAVLNHGHVVEKGTHQELMRRKGYYYNLCSVQGRAK